MKILVTTGLKETHGEEEEILFAGDWIKSSLDFEKNFKKRKYEIFESVWKDKKDLIDFFPYLNKLRDRLINKLSSDLNNIHNIDYPLKFWKILINPWLHVYLEAIYTRLETINRILNKKENLNFIYLNNLRHLDAPFDVRDFTESIRSSDVYNQFVFQKIINYFTDIKENKYLKLIYSNEKISKKENSVFLNIYKKQNYVRRFINLCLKYLTRDNKFFLELNSLGFIFILLNFKLNQIPFKDYEFFTYNNYYKLYENKSVSNPELRKKIFFEFDKNNDYENFLSRNFSKDIPKFLIEDFSTIQNFIKKIPYKSKIIVSDIKHEYDTIFKFWVANSVKNGSKLITSDHGGAYGFHHSIMHEDIADTAIRWWKPIKSNNVQLPVLHLLNKRRKKNKNKRKYLLTVGHDGTKYPKDVFLGPISGQILYQIECLSSFYGNLDLELKNNFLFKPHPTVDGWNIEKRLEHVFEKKIIPSSKKYWYYFNRSKVIVCTYPKTSFCEAMVSGPTILLQEKSYHKNREEFELLHKDLQKAQILFEDPILASKHLNKIWENVDDWWESEEVKKVRNSFFKKAALVEPEALEKWKKFFLNL